MSPGMDGLDLMSFGKVYYDQSDHKMRPKDKARPKDFLSISGTKMRKMAGLGREFCTTPRVPDDWSKSLSCVPQGFMPLKGWEVVSSYYKHKLAAAEEAKAGKAADARAVSPWTPFSRLHWPEKAAPPAVTAGAKAEGLYGTPAFKL